MEFISSYISRILLVSFRTNNMNVYINNLNKYNEAIGKDQYFDRFFADFYKTYCQSADNVVSFADFDKLLSKFIVPSGTRINKSKIKQLVRNFLTAYVSECIK